MGGCKVSKRIRIFYQHISKEYEHIDSDGIARIGFGYVKIPENMREAKEFVDEYSKPVSNLQIEINP